MTKDLPDFQTEVLQLPVTADKIKSGADASKPASPTAGDVYLATDTLKFYQCVTDGVWTGFDAAIIIQSRFGLAQIPAGASGSFLKGAGLSSSPAYAALAASDIASGELAFARGGTGLSTIALGSILYATALDVLAALAPTASNQVLRSTAANALQFAALVATDIPDLAASKITSGYFAIARGGTGLSTIAVGAILYATALDTLAALAPTAANQVLRSTAANALQIAALVAADIPNLDASKITSGVFDAARLPAPKMVRKTAGETVNNSAVLQNDNDLLLAIAANEVWEFAFTLLVETANVTADMKVAVTTPSGTIWYEFTGLDATATSTQQFTKVSGTALNCNTAAQYQVLVIRGVVINGASAGNLQLQWAQNTALAADLIVNANSCLIAHKLS